MAKLLEVQGLRTHFFTEDGVVNAVDGVSYDVEEGETVGLVGESGSGKSVSALSLVRLVPRPGQIVGGRVLFQGRDLLSLDERAMRRFRGSGIAMIFQEPMTSLNPVLTVGLQLTEAMEFHLGISRGAAREKAVNLLKMVEIPNAESRLSQYPHQFSGGMRQRLMLAIALSCEPKVIIADEPTTALDVTVQAQVLELMQELSAKTGVAIVLITHNLGVVARYANRINVMYAGKIVEKSTCLELFSNPRHPYTEGLLLSVPRLDLPRQTRLETIPGSPPDLMALRRGCNYEPRCAFAIPRCAGEEPGLMNLSETHRSACWVADQLPSSNYERELSRYD